MKKILFLLLAIFAFSCYGQIWRGQIVHQFELWRTGDSLRTRIDSLLSAGITDSSGISGLVHDTVNTRFGGNTITTIKTIIDDSTDRFDDSLANIYTESQTKEIINDSLDNTWRRYAIAFQSASDTAIDIAGYAGRYLIIDLTAYQNGGSQLKYINNGKQDQRILLISDDQNDQGNDLNVTNTGNILLATGVTQHTLQEGDALDLFFNSETGKFKEVGSNPTYTTYITNNLYTQTQTKTVISDSLQNYLTEAVATTDYLPYSDTTSSIAKQWELDSKLTTTDTSGLAADGDISALESKKLNLSGGTMSGGVNYGDNDLTNIDDADIDKLDFGTVTSAIYDNLGSIILDWSLAVCFQDTLIENLEYTFSNTISGKWITLELYNTASYLVDFPLTIRWAGGTAPIQTADKTDIYQFYKSGTQVFGVHIPNF